MKTKRFPLRAQAAILSTVLAGSSYCLSGFAKQTQKTTGEARVSKEDGQMTAIFRTPSGGKVTAFVPLNVLASDAEIGGTVERQISPQVNTDPASMNEDTSEIIGVVTIQPHNKQPNFPPIIVLPDTPQFKCPPTTGGGTDITYTPPKGPPTTVTLPPEVQVPPPDTAPPSETKPPTETTPCLQPAATSKTAQPSPPAHTCGIPQLVTSNGNMFITMASNGDPSKNICMIGGVPAACRSYSGVGFTAHVPIATQPSPEPALPTPGPSECQADPSQLQAGPNSVIAGRADEIAVGQTHVAQVKMTCSPVHLKPGQPCIVTTTAFCPGIHDVKGGSLLIKNYNPAVLNLADKVIPITNSPSSQGPSTQDLVKRDMLKSLAAFKQQLAKSPNAASAEGQKLSGTIDRLQTLFAK